MTQVHAVILAGGSGTRFWPASRRNTPKQLLPLAGRADEPLIAATVRRLDPLIPTERVWVSTGASLVEATMATLPRVPALAACWPSRPRATPPRASAGPPRRSRARRSRRDRRGAPGRPLHRRRAGFRDALGTALRAAEDGWLTTVGIVPTRPETGYGYIEVGDAVAEGVTKVYADLLVMPMFGVLPQVRPPGWFLRSA